MVHRVGGGCFHSVHDILLDLNISHRMPLLFLPFFYLLNTSIYCTLGACTPPQLISQLRRLSAGTSLPRHQLQRSVRRKIWGRKRGKWWTGLSPNIWVKASCSPLGATIREHHGRLSLSPPHPNPTISHPPSNHATYCSSGVMTSFRPPPLSTPNR